MEESTDSVTVTRSAEVRNDRPKYQFFHFYFSLSVCIEYFFLSVFLFVCFFSVHQLFAPTPCY